MNYDFVTDRLAIGTTPDSIADLNPFTHVIDCRAELDIAPMLVNSRFDGRYLWAPTADWSPLHPEHKPPAWFKPGVEFGLQTLSRPQTRLYVFCHMGANRSATMAWAILRAFGMMPGDCYAIIGSHRPIDIFGLAECGWWRDAETALTSFGYIQR
jgi:hypothetical protein